MLEGVFQLLGGCSTIRNIVLLAGLWYLLKTVVWLITLLWSTAKAYLLTSIFPHLYRVNLKAYEWAGELILIKRVKFILHTII